MKSVPHPDLAFSELYVDAIYEGTRVGNASDDPLPTLLKVDSQGGFRKRGSIRGKLDVLVLTTSLSDSDWPDALDPETGIFTYYGDNKQPGRELHNTGRHGNLILKQIFSDARSSYERRLLVPPIFLFARSGGWRDVKFLGLAVPGVSDLQVSEELVAIWRTSGGERFQNYCARFTVLDAAVIERKWINSLISGTEDRESAPHAWRQWTETGRRVPLRSIRTIEHRTRAEQVPKLASDASLIRSVHRYFSKQAHAFEYFSAAIARMMIPNISTIDVTRPSRDGGRDAIGKLRIGSGPSSILVDFALEAKCYGNETSVGVRDMSRLISRLRHRQFGILVTTSHVDLQAYKEVKEDQHPIVIISGADIVELLHRHGLSSEDELYKWMVMEFPLDANTQNSA